METKAIGLYVHIPFCKSKCNYCDFCSFKYSSLQQRDEYVDALCREINSYKGRNIRLNSLFFGGGTPSLLSCTDFIKIYNTIKDSFDILPDTEFTVEANPKTLDREKIYTFLDCGVNRISMGLQSIHENELKILGRIHDFSDFLETYKLCRECGVNNINIDLMYGIPEQTVESFGDTLDEVISLSPEHISVYGLILEEGTPLFERQEELRLPSEDEECDMYYLACSRLSESRYNHYEISNYALGGKECKHNLKYWRCDEYIGVGVSAYSYFEGRRFGNCDDYRVYLSSDEENYNRKWDECDEPYEYVMLRLRLSEGFLLSDYKNRFGVDFVKGREDIINSLSKSDYLMIKEGRISLTEKGLYVSNFILTELI